VQRSGYLTLMRAEVCVKQLERVAYAEWARNRVVEHAPVKSARIERFHVRAKQAMLLDPLRTQLSERGRATRSHGLGRHGNTNAESQHEPDKQRSYAVTCTPRVLAAD
jgi:hypothetical protein